MRTISEDLAQGRTVLYILPPDVSAEVIWEAIHGELWHRHFDILDGKVDPDAGARPIRDVLAEALGLSGASSPTVTPESLLARKGLPQVIWLSGLDRLPSDQAATWCSFLSRWAAFTAGERGQLWPVFCAPVSKSGVLPTPLPSDVRIVTRRWWGTSSATEIRLACRSLEDSGPGSLSALWREYLLPSLAGGSLSLAAHLFDLRVESEQELRSHLVDYAKERDWDPALLEQVDRLDRANSSLRKLREGEATQPDEFLRRPWLEGIISQTPEYGVELSSAALAMLGRWEVVRHRLWRAQAALLLPLLDGLRLRLCGILTTRQGADWPWRWRRPESPDEMAQVSSDPYGCQIRHLEALLRECRPFQKERHWLPLLSLAKWLRNELAHYRPVNYSHLLRLTELSESVDDSKRS